MQTPILKTGSESLTFDGNPLNVTLLNFWQWCDSDLLSNSLRGRLAEFIVATAIDVDLSKPRNEWVEYDLLTPVGIKIEIKSAAYVQTWEQRVLSKISFSIKKAKLWDYQLSKYSAEAKRHADVYIFCLLKHEVRETIDPLNLDHWDFYVLSTSQLDNYNRSEHSITLKSLQGLTPAVNYAGIKSAVLSAYTAKS